MLSNLSVPSAARLGQTQTVSGRKDDSQDKGKRKRQSGRNCLCGRNPRIYPGVPAGTGLCGGYDGVCRENAGSARDYGGFRPPEACVVRKGRPERKGSGAPEP